jgi:DNA-binding MarR family transcriptional regulator
VSAPSISSSAVYRLAAEPQTLAEDLRLAAVEWALLFACDGEHSVAEIGRELHLAPEARDRAVAKLVALGLLAERPLRLGEYVRARAAAEGVEEELPITLAELLRGAPARPVAPAAIAAAPGGSAPSRISPARPAPFRPLNLPEEPKPMPEADRPTQRPMKLRALIEFLVGRAESPEQGQLDVYRTFLRVDADLLRGQGITTLRFEDDRVVSDAELVRSICESVRKTTGAECPESVFA